METTRASRELPRNHHIWSEWYAYHGHTTTRTHTLLREISASVFSGLWISRYQVQFLMAVIAIGNSVLINTSFSGPSLGVGGTTSRRAFIKSGRTYVVNPKGKHQATIISMNGFGDNGSRLSEALSVRGDLDFRKDYSYSNEESSLSSTYSGGSLFPSENCKHWLVRVERTPTGVIERAQLVDYYCQILTTVMGNEMDAQMCIYHISLQSNYGFCCVLDDECAKELTSVPGVLSVQRDENVESNNKDYGATATNVKTKKLFVTGLSFYTSEKTLRAAFEGFGELVEVKIIMDKISKRSKGFAFVEYTTEAAASAALKEMNGKIINGWMIVVDVAKPNPPKYSRGAPRHGTR